MSMIAENLNIVLEKISTAADKSGRSTKQIKLVAVSKKQSVSKMQDYIKAWPADLGQPIFGEAYVQEFLKKKDEFSGAYISHLIGALQSNKAKDAVACFDLIESAHSEKLISKLNQEAKKLNKLQDIYIQVNISEDEQKSGFAPKELIPFVKDVFPQYEHLSLCGLMTITRYYAATEAVRPDFVSMRKIKEELEHELGKPLELSMGMSSDYDVAIEEGATTVRVGTALFGEREY